MTELAELAALPATAKKRLEKLLKAFPMLRSAVQPLLTGKVDDWHSAYAYTTGLQAFVYGFPYFYNAQLRHKWVTDEAHDPTFTPYAPVNQFWHATRLTDASYRDGGCPNNDTLYSIAWLDLSKEPVILSHPDMGERYFTFELIGIDSDNFAYVGQRTTGAKAGSFAIVGPDWDGDLPEDVDQSLAHSHTPWILIFGRTLVDDEDDAATVHELQAQYRLTPLSAWGEKDATVPARRDVLEPIAPEQDPLGPFKTLNAMLEENPPPAHHDVILKQFAQIGIGPGLDLDTQPDAVQAGSDSSRADRDGAAQESVHERRLGHHRQRLALSTARDRALRGRLPASRRRPVARRDHDQRPRRGRLPPQLHRFRRPQAERRQPLQASIRCRRHAARELVLVTRAVRNRYEPGRQPGRPVLDRRPDRRVEDGRGWRPDDPPPGRFAGRRRGSHWLPCPSDGEWFLVLRIYLPRPDVIEATWECPPVMRAH